MRYLILVLFLAACGGELRNRDAVPCLNSTVKCDCVISCQSTDLTVPSTPLTRGSVAVVYADDEGCEPVCH